ncbi:MAG: glycoside hydrolase, family 43 [Acidimicrobiia bacterium]|nr:glycoside hydrolase, family 43 [Acidimicrobiia bacterium]
MNLDFPDPAVIRVDGAYFAFATNINGANVPVARSGDLQNWQIVADAVPAAHYPKWASMRSLTWAPGVVQVAPNRFLLYASMPSATTGQQCIAVLAAAQPQGPYDDAKGGPLYCGSPGSTGAIDPAPMRTFDGKMYLYTKDVSSSRQIWAHRLSADGTSLTANGSKFVLTADANWEAGGIENPTMVATAQGWWLLYSGNYWRSDLYGIGAARCDGPLGPCHKVTTDQPWLSSAAGYSGPGGATVVARPDGELMLAFHSWDAAHRERQLHTAPVSFVGDRPALGSPAPLGSANIEVRFGYVHITGKVADPSTHSPVRVLVAGAAPMAGLNVPQPAGSFAVDVRYTNQDQRICVAAFNNAPGADTSLACTDLAPAH